MPLINTAVPQPPTTVQQIIAINTQMYRSLRSGYLANFSLLNNSKDIQSVLDGLGTDAASFFQLGAQVAAFLQSVNPSEALPKTDNQFAFNADGSATYAAPVDPTPVEPAPPITDAGTS